MSEVLRYVSDSSGVNVRETPGGKFVVGLVYGTLLVYNTSDAPKQAPYNGTTYTWIKVTYYKKGENDDYLQTTTATGWVTQKNTALVSTSVPAKSSVFKSETKNGTQMEKLTNARYIYKYLHSTLSSTKRWKTNPICAILGNMEAESGINPVNWQERDNLDLGYGLVHWTPAGDKFIDKLAKGEDKSDIDVQLKRIQAEVDYPAKYEYQWTETIMTFSEFTKDTTHSVSTLAGYFLRYYEKPNGISGKLAERGRCAEKWERFLTIIGDI